MDISYSQINIAVALVVFNRVDCVIANIASIRKAAPPRLYVISDGPRTDHPEDNEKVKSVREYIETHIDWPCELIKIYAKDNMGCDRRSSTGYDEVFAREEMAILIEDDSIAEPTFFSFCETMLNVYKDDDRVMMVSSCNMIPEYSVDDKDYFFSAVPMKIAWGTWSRAWKWHENVCSGQFDINNQWLKKVLDGRTYDFYKGCMLHLKMKHSLCWDAEWDCAMLARGGVGIVPSEHLMTYIGGNRTDSTHTTGATVFDDLKPCVKKNSIIIRDCVVWDEEYDSKMRPFMSKLGKHYVVRAWISYLAYLLLPDVHIWITSLISNKDNNL